MSKAANSPTARLLQSSRLFSIPRPLPQPQLETISSTGVYRASDTATLPYPTHQAIATPASSHHRGDWGLKRPLPKKATQDTSTPHIRVSAQDTPEHITDFGSAADHTQTQAKWQEMGIPVVLRPAKDANGKPLPPLSAFEDGLDNTTLERGGSEQQQRWKYQGPWIAGMQEGDFDLYTQKLGRRRAEWKAYLRNHIAEQRLADRRRAAQEMGEALTQQAIASLREELRPNDAEIQEVEKDLRDSHQIEGLSSQLTSLISQFLDLPAVRSTDDFQASVKTRPLSGLMANFNFENSPESAPPSTHPSAGLSYLRTSAVMENHPVHGPQSHRSPVLSRVVRPRNSVNGTEHQAKLGVGGVITPDPITANFSGRTYPTAANRQNAYDADTMAASMDPDLEGGNKMYVHPKHAYIDEDGRIRLTVERGKDESIAIKRGSVEHIHEARAAASRGSPGFGSAFGSSSMGRGANYGHSLPDMRRMPQQGQAQRSPDYSGAFQQQPQPGRKPGVEGFDRELSKQGASGRLDDESATARIRELLDSRRR